MKITPTRRDCPTCKHLKIVPIMDGLSYVCTDPEGILCDVIVGASIVMCDHYKRKEEGDD